MEKIDTQEQQRQPESNDRELRISVMLERVRCRTIVLLLDTPQDDIEQYVQYIGGNVRLMAESGDEGFKNAMDSLQDLLHAKAELLIAALNAHVAH